MSTPEMDDPIARQAIEWMVLLRSGEAAPQDYDDFLRWRHENPLHERACRRIEQTLGQFEPLLTQLPSDAVRQALLSPSSRRKALQYGLGMIAVASLGSLLLNQVYPLSPLLSDAKTSTAQRQLLSLNDGSQLTLNARTAVDINVRPDAALRRVTLHSGGMMASITQDKAQPFMISTRMGDIMALKAKVNVNYDDDGVHVGVLEDIVKITNSVGQSVQLSAGRGAWFDGKSLYPNTIVPEAEAAWVHGRLEVHDRSLASMVRMLRDYSPGIIRLDPEIADLRVSGNFPLDDIPYTLDSLAQTMPIAIVQTTRYWVHLRAASVGRR
ncbi:FecR family protein [Dickeya dadantii subsp. dieffenbachiae]|uniref:FecR family protein n=1 Tax=Dickeya dadantii TaxID=204038 RepID=UPI00039B7C19|nr:FecR domain-containing protein [Dickeya dadantii]